MAEGKKSPRSKAPARSGGAGGSGGSGGKSGGPRRSGAGKGGQSGGQSGGGSGGWTTSKPGGKPGGSRSGAGKPTGKPTGKTGGKPGGFRKDDRADDRRDDRRDDRKPGGSTFRRPAKDDQKAVGGNFRKPKEKTERVDDFDFDVDVTEAPRSFPKPARKAGPEEGKGGPGRPGRPGRPERARPEYAARRPAKAAEPVGEAPELEDGKTVTAGRNPVRELLENTPRRVDGVFVRKGAREAKVQEIVALADDNRIKVQFVDDSVLRRLYSGTHQGVVAVTAAVEYAELDALIAGIMDAPLPVLLALDKVQDPGNLGAMARTAWALGAAGIIVPRHGGAYIGAGAMRASAGALHHLPVARVTNMSQALDACAEAGLSVLCADASGEDAYQATVRLPAVLVLGGEEKGVRPGVSKHCGQKLAIPLRRDFDSLNVSQAAAILLARLGRP